MSIKPKFAVKTEHKGFSQYWKPGEHEDEVHLMACRNGVTEEEQKDKDGNTATYPTGGPIINVECDIIVAFQKKTGIPMIYKNGKVSTQQLRDELMFSRDQIHLGKLIRKDTKGNPWGLDEISEKEQEMAIAWMNDNLDGDFETGFSISTRAEAAALAEQFKIEETSNLKEPPIKESKDTKEVAGEEVDLDEDDELTDEEDINEDDEKSEVKLPTDMKTFKEFLRKHEFTSAAANKARNSFDGLEGKKYSEMLSEEFQQVAEKLLA